jgi:hypothetical protein
VSSLSPLLRISEIKLKPFRIWTKVQHEKVAPNQYLFNTISFETFRQVVGNKSQKLVTENKKFGKRNHVFFFKSALLIE